MSTAGSSVFDPSTLPVWAASSHIEQSLRSAGALVLQGDTGSGKTTQLPQMMVQWGFARTGRIIVVEPRRLAARAMAARVAYEMKQRGTEGGVGYATRYERFGRPDDVVEFVTDGVLLNRITRSPDLFGVSAVIFDEVHERRAASDLALALLMLLKKRRPELILVAMSATMDGRRLSSALGVEPVQVQGRAYSVETLYRPLGDARVWDAAADAVKERLASDPAGDVLVFMPGSYEIQATLSSLARRPLPGNPLLVELTANSPPEAQERCFAPSPRPRVIVATNVAETSITLPYVTSVVDSGLARVLRFDQRRGMNSLRVEAISASSARQRAGRAGRTAPGVAVRLWSQAEERGRPQHDTPEILRTDLTEWVLRIKALGAQPRTVPWLDAPPEPALEYAERTLEALEALDPEGALSPIGTMMSEAPVHPRLARALAAVGEGELDRLAGWCAILWDPTLAMGRPSQLAEQLGPQYENDLDMLAQSANRGVAPEGDKPHRTAGKLIQERFQRSVAELTRWRRSASLPSGNLDAASALMLGYSDRLGLVLEGTPPRMQLRGGAVARVDSASTCTTPGPALILDMEERDGVKQGGRSERVVRLAVPVAVQAVERLFPAHVQRRTHSVLREDRGLVERVEQLLFRDELPLWIRVHRAGPEAAGVLAEAILAGRLHLDDWDEAAQPWIDRVQAVASWFPERGLITYNQEELLLALMEFCDGATKVSQLKDRNLLQSLRNVMSYDDLAFVERMAPSRLDLPSGFKMRLRYTAGQPPTGRARIQDLVGVQTTPMVGGGRMAVRIEILAPSNRPVQVTEDLANFWKTLYPEIRPALSRRYPKHKWP